jgi:hypothetical protein
MGLAWSVENHRIEYKGGRVSLDGMPDETWRRKFNRPDHEFKVGSRRLVLKTVGGGGELWCRGILIPTSKQHIARISSPPGSFCGRHADKPAAIACAKCGTFSCLECEAVDGTHCVTCMGIFTEADMSVQVLASVPGPLRYFGVRALVAAVVFAIVFGLRALGVW